MEGPRRIAIVAVALLLFAAHHPTAHGSNPGEAAPAEFAPLYAFLKTSLDNYDRYLAAQGRHEPHRLTFGAELLPANANRGPDLLTPQALAGVTAYLDRLQEMGVQGVTIPVSYPLLKADFPRAGEYLAFYRQVAREVRRRGLKLDVENGIVFANSPFSKISVSYAGLTLARYGMAKRQMAETIIRELEPDYLTLGSEPDTEATLLALRELNDPRTYTDLVRTALRGLERGRTAIGAGIGTWGSLETVKSLAATTDLDFIDIHVYPVGGHALENTVLVAEVARRYHKRLVMDEAWLYKSGGNEAQSIAANAEIFRRDAFGFWAGLDQQFLASMVKLADTEGVEYISPFWTTYFFAYLDYSPEIQALPYAQLVARAHSAAVQNLVAGRFSSTGEFYRKLIREHP
jgi:hypothetical protein